MIRVYRNLPASDRDRIRFGTKRIPGTLLAIFLGPICIIKT